jgi:glycosyltransferase involved in cell wall biosynthesis
MKVAALVPYSLDSCAGQRFRIETWARHLAPRGIEIDFLPFGTDELNRVMAQQGHLGEKATALLSCFGRHAVRVLGARRPDLVFIYREAALAGPALFEQLSRRWRVPIIYDIDEPLFVRYVSPTNGRLNVLKFVGKFDSLMAMSDHVMVVNRAIQDYVTRHTRPTSIFPMTVETDRYRPGVAAPGADGKLRVGWVGTRTSQPNLQVMAEPLARLTASHGAQFRVIADNPMTMPGVDLDFVPWTYAGEVPQLAECQIGIVPIKPDTWSPWKFYFKTVQYMGMGMPVVASPIGSNTEIIEEGKNGLFADTPDEWYRQLARLAEDPALRRRLGEAARATVLERFSLSSQVDQFESLLRSFAS